MNGKRFACFGDSNTYGFDYRSLPDQRFPPEKRWPEMLAARLGWDVFNLGINGMQIPYSKREVEESLNRIEKKLPLDLIIIMLGSNDIWDFLSRESDVEKAAERIALKMDRFMSELNERKTGAKVLLISPPKLFLMESMLEVVYKLPAYYYSIAKKHNAYFAAASSWELPISDDDIHLSEEGHFVFAEKIGEFIHNTII